MINHKIIKAILLFYFITSIHSFANGRFPDGSIIPEWFSKNEIVKIETLGRVYKITDFGVTEDSTVVQTKQIQSVIDLAYENGGGVISIPRGVFLSGALFFKQNTHLFLEKDAVIKGSDDISDFPILPTRIEGQSINYFAALINADNIDKFSISGKGTINGNGLRYWKSFWLRRKVNPKCTNIEELRPRLVYISNSKNVQISGVSLINSPFWTTHLYKCENVKLLNLHIFSPESPVRAPSTDGIDIDVCTNVHVKNCSISVNDDAVALKGGKGPTADKDDRNGGNFNVIIEDCDFGFCHSALTCGSESIHNHNIILRRCKVNNAKRLLWLKMRPDTPQNYEYILVEDIEGDASSFLYIKPWTQFFDLQGQSEIAVSYASNITMRNIIFDCDVFLDVRESDQYSLSDIKLENLKIKSKNADINVGLTSNFKFEDVNINGSDIRDVN